MGAHFMGQPARRFLIMLCGIVAVGTLGPAVWILVNPSRKEWEEERWRASSDARVLARAGLSAWREYPHIYWTSPSPTRREQDAVEARVQIERRLLEMGSDAARAITGLWRSGEDEEWTRSVIVAIGPDAIPTILEALEHRDTDVRRQAALSLDAFSEDPGIVRAARRHLTDRDFLVRSQAAHVMGYSRGLLQESEEDAVDQELIRLMEDDEDMVRIGAIEALGYRRARAAVPRLIELAQPDSPDRDHALGALASICDPIALPVLVRGLEHAADSIAWCLPSFGAAAIPALLDVFDTPLQEHAHAVLRGGGFDGLELPDDVLGRLFRLVDDPSPERRGTALILLASSRNDRALDRVVEALAHPDLTVRRQTVWPLYKASRATVTDVARQLREDDTFVSEIRRVLGEGDAELADTLAAIALDAGRADVARGNALDALGDLRPDLLPQTVEAILNAEGERLPDWHHFWITNAKECLPPALRLRLLANSDGGVRASVIWTIAPQDGSEAIAAVIRAARDDPEDYVRRWAVLALGSLRAAEAVPVLAEIVRRKGCRPENFYAGDECFNAIETLGKIGNAEAQGILREVLDLALRNDDPGSRRLAATALAMTGNASVIPELRKAIQEETGVACRMSHCGDSLVLGALEALTCLAEDGTDELLALLGDRHLRTAAAEALGKTSSPRAFPKLAELVGDPKEEMRRAAAIGLGHVGGERAVSVLLPLLEDSSASVATGAACALQRIAGRDFGIDDANDSMPEHVAGDLDSIRAAIRSWAAGR